MFNEYHSGKGTAEELLAFQRLAWSSIVFSLTRRCPLQCSHCITSSGPLVKGIIVSQKRAKKWAEENKWFGTDEVMTNAAITIHNNISQEGIEVDSDEYYNEVNSRLRKYFPESFDDTNDEPKKETPKPVQTVASAGRSRQGRRTVKLTKSQVAIAKRLGVPLEEYARYVKEDK